MADLIDYTNAVKAGLDGKAPVGHTHDDRYYTETEADGRFVRTVNGSGPDPSGNVAVAGEGGSTVTDATASTKGVVQLAGDLGGTAAAPTVPGLAARVRVDAAQALDATQKAQGRANLGIPAETAGRVLEGAAGGGLAWGTPSAVVARALGWVIVTDAPYNAVGNGVADDAAALQAAINTGKTVFLPAGTYLVSVPLNLVTNVQLMGAGKNNRTIIKKTSATANGRGINAIIAGYNAFHFRVQGMRLNGNRSTYATGNTVSTLGLHVEGCAYYSVADMLVTDVSVGYTSHSSYIASYDRCTALRAQGYAFRATDETTSTIWSNCLSWGCGGGWEMVSCFYCTIIASANDHCCYGGKSDDPFLPEGSGGSYTAAGYCFYLNTATVTLINPGVEKGFAQFIYARNAEVTVINPSITDVQCHTPAWDLISLRGSGQPCHVKFISPWAFSSAVNMLAESSYRAGVRIENPDLHQFECDRPLDISSTFGQYAYVGGQLPTRQDFGARTAAPTTGTWKVGDRVQNSTPAAGGYLGWICTTAGTPGTWKGYGLIQA